MRLTLVLLAALVPHVLGAQGGLATVSGVVRDGIERAPLPGATVQLVSADSAARFGAAAVADSLGRYTIADVPRGRYTVGFFHPLLDSLGVAPPLRGLIVDGGHLRADLASPTAAGLRAAICGARTVADSGGVVVGVVRDAGTGSPVANAAVAGEWVELSFRAEGITRRVPRLVATTGDDGWFALCNVPSGGTLWLRAGHGADSTDQVELQVPSSGFLRRELSLGLARLPPADAPAAPSDTSIPRARRAPGEGVRLVGVVVAATTGQPVIGARVNLVDRPQTLVNERGEWALADAPAGTRMLEVRAVGFYPVRRAVDVVPGAPPVRVSMSTLRSVLDTVRVTARRLYDRDSDGFEQRRSTGAGRFLTADDIQRRAVRETSELFRMIPGLRLVPTDYGTSVTMRSPFGDCEPSIFLDGLPTFGSVLSDIDVAVLPRNIRGIEIHVGPAVPPQFQPALNGCGAIVIWTR